MYIKIISLMVGGYPIVRTEAGNTQGTLKMVKQMVNVSIMTAAAISYTRAILLKGI